MRKIVLGHPRKSEGKSKIFTDRMRNHYQRILFNTVTSVQNSRSQLSRYCFYVDPGFGGILDVFVDSPITFTTVVPVTQYHARGSSCPRSDVRLASIATRFRVCGSPGYGETSQAPLPRIAVLQWPAQQIRMIPDNHSF